MGTKSSKVEGDVGREVLPPLGHIDEGSPERDINQSETSPHENSHPDDVYYVNYVHLYVKMINCWDSTRTWQQNSLQRKPCSLLRSYENFSPRDIHMTNTSPFPLGQIIDRILGVELVDLLSPEPHEPSYTYSRSP